MTKKIIQVPVEPELLGALDRLSQKQHRSRSDLIREACTVYLRDVEEEELDRLYRRGYTKQPEKTDMGKAQVEVLAQVMPAEDW